MRRTKNDIVIRSLIENVLGKHVALRVMFIATNLTKTMTSVWNKHAEQQVPVSRSKPIMTARLSKKCVVWMHHMNRLASKGKLETDNLFVFTPLASPHPVDTFLYPITTKTGA